MSRRLLVLTVLAALLGVGFVIERTDDPEVMVASGIADPADGDVIPVVGPETDLSSTWFCAGGTADETAFADHVVTILNPTASSVTTTMTVMAGVVAPPPTNAGADELDPEAGDTGSGDTGSGDTGSGDTGSGDTGSGDTGDDAGSEQAADVDTTPVVRTVEIGPNSRVRIALSDLVTGPVASAVVEAAVGGIVVEHEVASIHGSDSKPCSTWASDTWHFAWGTTAREARELLVLFNPFPDDAIVDGRFSTEDGVREPVRFDGLVVPARSTLAVDLGDDVTRRDEVAATITARTGRIVVDRIVRLNEEGGARGLTVQAGVSHPQLTWMFPDGFTSEEVGEEYVVYNPGEEVAEVSLELIVDRPEENGIPEPFDLSLPPGSHAVVDVTADGRVPSGVAHSGIARSDNGVPVVVERVLTFAADTRRGMSVTTGSPVQAQTWTFAAGSTNSVDDEWIVVLNPDPQVLAEVAVTAVVGGQRVPIAELQELVVEAGERVAIRLGERIQRDDLAVVVTSTEPIVVERGRYHVGGEGRGTSNAIGVPSVADLVRPGDPLDVVVDADLGDLEGVGDDPAPDDVPAAPDDVELPEPDSTISFDDPDAEADVQGSSTTTAPPDSSTTEPPSDGSTETTTGGVPDTTPSG